MSGGVLHTRGAHTVRTWRIRGATNGSGMDRARERGGSRPAAAVKAALRRRARALGNVDVGLTDGCSQGSKTRVGASGMRRRRRGGAGGGSGGAVAVEAAHKSRRGREGRGAGGRGEGALVVRDKGGLGSIAFSPNLNSPRRTRFHPFDRLFSCSMPRRRSFQMAAYHTILTDIANRRYRLCGRFCYL